MSEANSEIPGADSTRNAITAAVGWLRDLMLALIILVLVIQFVYRPVKVEGTSMMPSLEDQDRIFINKFNYQFGMGEVLQGDTVVSNACARPSINVRLTCSAKSRECPSANCKPQLTLWCVKTKIQRWSDPLYPLSKSCSSPLPGFHQCGPSPAVWSARA